MNIKYDIENYVLESSDWLSLPNWQIICFPDYAWPISSFDFTGDLTDIIWLDGETHEHISLAADEALLPESLYYALGLDQMETPRYTFYFAAGVSLELQIVGLLPDTVHLTFDPNMEQLNIDEYVFRIVVSYSTVNPARIPQMGGWTRFVIIQTDSPERVGQLCEQMEYNFSSVYEQQNAALEKIRAEKGNKAIISCAMLLLLGINLYSSFTNALNDRKFEIGVKRAIGASAWSIVRQFLYESFLVMAANILISIALVADIFIVYKYVYERVPDEWGSFHSWILYISPHSIAMFTVCAVTLTVVFSLIFAYKSTRVEIVQYLKAE